MSRTLKNVLLFVLVLFLCAVALSGGIVKFHIQMIGLETLLDIQIPGSLQVAIFAIGILLGMASVWFKFTRRR